jgi:hypothetical protein
MWICILLLLFLLNASYSIATPLHHRGNLQSSFHPSDIDGTKVSGKYQGKIAFLFLSRKELFHDDIWSTFFSWYAPASYYSIYWHPSPDYVPPKYSFFAEKIIKNRVPTFWADWSLIRAYRMLLKTALADYHNEYFVLLSESCIPLVPFGIWYRTMMRFKKYSIVNSCHQDSSNNEIERWKPTLNNATQFRREHWRKSSQWVALTRKHARLVVYDTDLAPFFHEVSPADEHYVPSLLAMHGLSNETTCTDGLAHVRWNTKVDPHPIMYGPEMIGNYEHPAKPSIGEKNMSIVEYYKKHQNFMSNIRNSGTPDQSLNGLCAYEAFPANRTLLSTPHGGLLTWEEAPCHFAGRKFPLHSRYQVLYHSHEIFHDEVFNLSSSREEVFNRTLHSRLRFDHNDNNTYFIDGHNLYLVQETEYLQFPSVKRFTLPPLTEEERKNYLFVGHFTFMGAAISDKFLYRFKEDNTIWLLYNGTRRVIFDFETFLAFGFNTRNIEFIAPPRVKYFIVDPPLKSSSKSLS